MGGSISERWKHPPSDHTSHEFLELCVNPSNRPRASKLLNKKIRQVLNRVPIGKELSLEAVFLSSYPDTVAQISSERAICAATKQEALQFSSTDRQDKELILLLASAPRGGPGPRSLATLYFPLELSSIWESHFEQMVESKTLSFESSTKSIYQVQQIKLGAILLEETRNKAEPGTAVGSLLKQHLTESDLGPEYRKLLRRLGLLMEHEPHHLQEMLESTGLEEQKLDQELLMSYLSTINQWTKHSPRALYTHVNTLIPYSLKKILTRELPETLLLPGRSKPVEVQYPDDAPPFISSKLQDFFHWKQPKLLNGKVDLVCHLLAPNGRACQITKDLASFWLGSYHQVRKDLRGRYPKHDWPETPSIQDNR